MTAPFAIAGEFASGNASCLSGRRSMPLRKMITDPVTIVVAPLVLLLVALAACQIPAGRAMRVDPAALRMD
jgi:hypothetical protein